MIRTIIVDDEILSRIGLQSFLDGKDDIVVSGTFAMVEEAIPFLEENPVDVVITDIEMDEINGLEFIRMIRERNLADGVIIVSCHEDFSYAQEAISMGTDSYILKHSVTQKKLIEEVKKVYEKYQKKQERASVGNRLHTHDDDSLKNSEYCIVIFHYKNGENYMENLTRMDETMLLNLLEGIIKRYHMGTLFSPVNEEMFLLMQFEVGISEEEYDRRLTRNLQLLEKNLHQYINGSLFYGISGRYKELSQTREYYTKALEALDQKFYENEKIFYYWKRIQKEWELHTLSIAGFLEKNGLEMLEKELQSYYSYARRKKVSSPVFKENLIHEVNQMLYDLSNTYPQNAYLQQHMREKAMEIAALNQLTELSQMEKRIRQIMEELWKGIREEMQSDDLAEAFRYLEENLAEKISLNDLAEISCLSVSSFCKKFKDRTGMTLVQYMNVKRIEHAQVLLQDKNYSLWDVAEITGFRNANYLVRVFKKITGQTVSEYRKQFGIQEV